MGLRVKVRLTIVKIKTWWKGSRYKKLEWQISELDRIHNAIAESLTILIENRNENFHLRISSLEKEPELRRAQAKRANDKFKSHMKIINDHFDKVSSEIGAINNILNNKTSKVDETLARLNKSLKKLDIIEEIVDKADVEYTTFIGKLKKDISEFKKNDASVVRLASLETRITMLEIKQKELLKEPSDRNIHLLNEHLG